MTARQNITMRTACSSKCSFRPIIHHMTKVSTQ